MGVDSDLVGVYFSWPVAVGFLDKPIRNAGQPQISEDGSDDASTKVESLPALKEGGSIKAIGRGSAH